jgi:NADPH:quinone reductase-like Zn-dependent oxidoreductase
MVTQLAREAGAYVVGTGRAADPQTALDFGAQEFVDLENDVDRAQLSEIVQRVRDGRVRANVGNVATFDDAVAAFNPTERRTGKTIIRVRP